MDILYNVDDHVSYFVALGGQAIVFTGRIVHLEETGHKTDAYNIKRDHNFQDNVGMCGLETDIVSPLCIFGLVSEK